MNGRIYDPLLGRFLSADTVVQFPGNVQSFNRYSYVQNNPLSFTDSSGFEIDPKRTTGNVAQFKSDILALAAASKAAGNSGNALVLDMADRVDTSQSRFLATKSGGVIDMRHFLAAAARKDQLFVTEGMTEKAGRLVEVEQAKVGSNSAWGVEDLPSNRAGLNFESNLNTSDIETTLADQIVAFVDTALGGVVAPPAAADIDALNLIRNFSDEPVLDANDPSILTDPATGIRYKSNGDAEFERKQLDTMAANGISPTNVGTNNEPNGIRPVSTIPISDVDDDDDSKTSN